jgi:hypothetical protein
MRQADLCIAAPSAVRACRISRVWVGLSGWRPVMVAAGMDQPCEGIGEATLFCPRRLGRRAEHGIAEGGVRAERAAASRVVAKWAACPSSNSVPG